MRPETKGALARALDANAGLQPSSEELTVRSQQDMDSKQSSVTVQPVTVVNSDGSCEHWRGLESQGGSEEKWGGWER